ncbi:MAG: DUF4429 domain-containing protein, partial [Kitasatospora sp.]|nr:DUF4429 domain-containing protein [Kitasatospora sp.]
GERRIPYAALAAVDLSPGKRGTVVLRLTPRPGADPLMDAADGQLKAACDPYRLVIPSARETLAEYYAQELTGTLPDDTGEPAPAALVSAPSTPLHFKAYDGKASFDGKAVSFRWFWTGASSAKWKAGDQTFRVDELEDLQWRSPELLNGHLRLVRRGSAPGSAAADQDPAAVVFGLGYGPVHESLPFAAAVLQAVRAAAGAGERALRSAVRPDPADIAERIRHLGELHATGLLTDDEFTAKKAELLAEL